MATWNPLDASAGISFSNGNLTATTTSAFAGVRADAPRNSGKLYFELHFVGNNNQNDHVGLIGAADNLVTPVSNPGGYLVLLGLPGGGAVTPVDITFGFKVDFTVGTLAHTVDGTTYFSAALPSSILYPWFDAGEVGAQCTANFGGSAFAYPVPAGFSSWDSGSVPGPPDRLVMIANAGPNNLRAAWSSDAGQNWTAVSMPTFLNAFPSTWMALAYAPSLHMFVAVSDGFGDNNNNVARSTDGGHTWTGTAIPNPATWTIKDICWSADLALFVIVTSAGPTASSRILTSSDGITWTARTLPSTGISLNGVCWSHELGLFCAVTSGAAYTSPDGITWTARTMPGDNYAMVAWCGGSIQQFIACSTNGWLTKSADGVTWSAHFFFGTGYAYTDADFSTPLGQVVVVGGNTGVIGRSTNLSSWTETSGFGTTPFLGVCWSGFWTIVGQGVIRTSPDGINWTARTAPSSASWRRVVSAPISPTPQSIELDAAFTDETTLAALITTTAPPLLLAAAFEDAAEFTARFNQLLVQAEFADEAVFLPQITVAPPAPPPPVQTVVVLTG